MQMLYPLAGLIYLGQIVLFARLNLTGGLDLISDAVSDYALGPARQAFTSYVLPGSLAALLLGAALLVDGRFPMRAPVCLLLLAVLRLGVLAFPTDPGGQQRSRTGTLHLAFATASFALAYITIDVLHPRAIPLTADWAVPVLRVLKPAITLALAGTVICLIPALRRAFGLCERLFLLTTMLWLAVFALSMP